MPGQLSYPKHHPKHPVRGARSRRQKTLATVPVGPSTGSPKIPATSKKENNELSDTRVYQNLSRTIKLENAKAAARLKIQKMIDKIDDNADKADTTLSAFSYSIMAVTTVWTNIAPFLMNTLNSLPWISTIITIFNGLFRAVRAFALKSLVTEHHAISKSIYAKRAWTTLLGISSMALGLASMFTIAASLPLTFACAAIDFVNTLLPLAKAIKRCFIPDPDPVKAKKDEEEKGKPIERMLGKLESTILAAVTLTGTVLLFTPPFTIVGLGLLLGASAYSLLDRYDLNPIKLGINAIKKRFFPEKKSETDQHPSENLTPLPAEGPRNKHDSTYSILFEEMYCKPIVPPTPKKEDQPIYHNRDHYPKEYKRNLDIKYAAIESNGYTENRKNEPLDLTSRKLNPNYAALDMRTKIQTQCAEPPLSRTRGPRL